MLSQLRYRFFKISDRQQSGKAFHLLILLIAALLLNSVALGQKEHKRLSSNLLLEGQVYYGFLIPHHVEMEIFNRHFPALEISLTRKTYGRARWEYMYNYPLVGVAYWFSDLGGTPYLGDAHAVFPYINFPLNKSKTFQLYLRIGLGLGYLTKKFDRLENYKNIAIGSNINAAINMLLQVRKRLGSRFVFSFSVGLTHFSNGSMKSPNYGINIPSISGGLAFRLAKENPYFKQKLLPELSPFYFDGKKSVDLDVSLAFGYKDMLAEYGGRYFVFAANANLMKPISFKTKYGAALDFSYDGTDEQLILMENGTGYLTNDAQLIQIGMGGVFELNMSRVSLIGTLGIYIYTKYKGDGNIYEKLALKYQFDQHWFSSITLKAHAGRADYISLGVGYKFMLIFY